MYFDEIEDIDAFGEMLIRLAQVIEKLPEREKCAEVLYFVKLIVEEFTWGALFDHPQLRRVGSASASKSLDIAMEKISEAMEVIRYLPFDTFEPMHTAVEKSEIKNIHIRKLFEQPGEKVETIGEIMREIYLVVADSKSIIVKNDQTKVGRPRKRQAEMVTDACRKVYVERTGNKASMTSNPAKDGQVAGDFPRFVTDVFAVLGIEASAESQIRLSWKKARENLAA